MKKIDSKLVLWQNVSALMTDRYGRENLTRLASEAKIGPGTVSRIKAHETSVGLDVVEALARLFKIEPWQLLVPGLSASTPQQIGDAAGKWPFPGVDHGRVAALPAEKLAKIEGYIESVLDTVPPAENRRAA